MSHTVDPEGTPVPCPSCGADLVDGRYVAEALGMPHSTFRSRLSRGGFRGELPNPAGRLTGNVWLRDAVDSAVKAMADRGWRPQRGPGRPKA